MISRVLQVALNGDGTSPAMPRTPAATAEQAAASVAAGATSIHLHAFDEHGAETLEGVHVARTLRAVRQVCPGVPINMTTFAEIEPDPARRKQLVEGWTVLPDLVPANQGEDGIDDLTASVAARGVGVEACVLSMSDVEGLVRRGGWERFARIFVEPTEEDPAGAAASAAAMGAALDRAGCRLEQVHHGVGMATWAVIRQAAGLGHGVRVGLEDTEVLPDGAPATGNPQLVAAAASVVEQVRGPA